jgi:hypothetical protein
MNKPSKSPIRWYQRDWSILFLVLPLAGLAAAIVYFAFFYGK